jgi:hypothetical protein
MEDIFLYFDNLPSDVTDPERLFATAATFKLDNNILQKLKELPAEAQDDGADFGPKAGEDLPDPPDTKTEVGVARQTSFIRASSSEKSGDTK